VLGREPAVQVEILTSVLTVVLMVTAIAVVVDHWAPVEVVVATAEAMAGPSLAEAALHELVSCPLRYFEALRCLHSHSNQHSTHLLVVRRPC
jgi:hypothetical protein